MELTFDPTSADSYQKFLASRLDDPEGDGIKDPVCHDFLFDFQKDLVEWAARKGRAAIFADCGMGKTAMQLSWADQVARETSKPVLLLTPLAVGGQTLREAERFGINAHRSRDGKVQSSGVCITNYEQLPKFRSSDFGGVVCDESSAIKNFQGKTKEMVVYFMRGHRFRLLCTATAAPNDFIELGTSAEALGHMGFRDMVTKFFKMETSTDHRGWGRTKYRFRGHAELPFWQWVCSWARALRRPSDLGYSDEGFVLPPLHEKEVLVQSAKLRDGMLFAIPAQSLPEQREERRNSMPERCDAAVELIAAHIGQSVMWCELNDEADRMEKLVPDAVQVSGSMSDEQKEEILEGFTSGEVRVLVTKPKIGCWGLNWQGCHNVVIFPSHSFEQYYQAVRRCWRFGQKNPVTVNCVVSEGEEGVIKNVRRKSKQCDEMFERLVNTMNDPQMILKMETFANEERVPSWL